MAQRAERTRMRAWVGSVSESTSGSGISCGVAPVVDSHEVNATPKPREAERLLADRGFDVMVVDNRMPGKTGLELIRDLVQGSPEGERPQVILMTAHATVDNAIEAMDGRGTITVSMPGFMQDAPYADGLVNLVVGSDLGSVPMEEVLRVLCPDGVALIREKGKDIVVINGSPKGKNSITYQSIRYLQKHYPNVDFTVFHVGQKIKAIERKLGKGRQNTI